MRTKLYISAILLIVMSLLTSCATTKLYSKHDLNIKGGKLGILPFQCDIPSIGNTVSDTIGANLLGTGVTVFERTYLTKILEEQGLTLTGLTQTVAYSRIGKLCDVDHLLVGTVTATVYHYVHVIPNATARIVNVNTGEIVLSATWTKGRSIQSAVQIGNYLAKAIKKELRGKKYPFYKKCLLW